MARIRYIKPGFFHNEELAECDPLARLLFAGLWTEADKEGRLKDRPKKLKALLLPFDECNIEDLLEQLHQHKFILRYAANGEACIQINNFLKHQNPHPKEAPSDLPAPPQPGIPTPLIVLTEYVYFIRCEETLRIKIGKANDPVGRLSSLQTGSAAELVLLGAVEGGLELEREIHIRFEHLKTRGEWFQPGAELLAFIAEQTKAEDSSLLAPAPDTNHNNPAEQASQPNNDEQCNLIIGNELDSISPAGMGMGMGMGSGRKAALPLQGVSDDFNDPVSALAEAIADVLGMSEVPEGKPGEPFYKLAGEFHDATILPAEVRVFEKEEWFGRRQKTIPLTLKYLREDVPGWVRARRFNASKPEKKRKTTPSYWKSRYNLA